jgi:hypothetical protein
MEAVQTAYNLGYKAIVVDSATHEHDGEGGFLDMQANDLEDRVERYMKKYPTAKEWEVREKLTPSSWITPKRERKRMMQVLLACSTSVPIIFCFRAEEKAFGSKDGKMVAFNPPVWTPLCGKGMPFEMTVFFMLHREHPGVPVPLKLEEQHKALFPLDKPINEESGKRVAEWAKGGAEKPQDAPIDPEALVQSIEQAKSLDELVKAKDAAKKHLTKFPASFGTRVQQAFTTRQTELKESK